MLCCYCWHDSVSGLILDGFKFKRFAGCLYSFIIFCSFMLSLELLRKTLSIFLANSVSTEGPSSSCTNKSSSTWPNIFRLILIGVAVGSVASAIGSWLSLFQNSSPTEDKSSLLTTEPTSVIILIIVMQEPTSLLV